MAILNQPENKNQLTGETAGVSIPVLIDVFLGRIYDAFLGLVRF